MVNLNRNEYLNVKALDYGKTQNIIVKLGRCLYYVDVNKNNDSANVDFYKKTSPERNKQSKYSTDGTLGVTVKNDSFLNREFFDNISKIKDAQNVYRRFGNILK